MPLGGCGDDDTGAGGGAAIVVTTSILGDIVQELVGDAVEVEVVMPPGVDPHQLAPSARQVAAMREAEVLVVNGLGLEAAHEDTIAAAAADGTEVVAVAELAPDHRTAEGGVEHGDDGHDHGDEDPHVFTDPARMAVAVARLAEALAAEGVTVEVVELHTEALGGAESDAATYVELVRSNARRIARALA